MRRRNDIDPAKYIRVRIKMLRDERAKNEDQTAHLVLDKSIFELTEVLMLLERNNRS
tara:strand:+ start:1654 stop:1824 length:171 start_codon:yes stop_codon:yes gene_type:complete